MRTISTALSKVLAGTSRAVHARVKIADSGGTLREVTALEGHDFLEELTISESVDQPVATADVALKREVYYLSLSPLMAGSKLNAGGALVQMGRRITIETATVPEGVAPQSGDWQLVFDGEIDDVDPADAVIRLTCRDRGCRLQDTFIERERIYGLGLAFGVRPWEPLTAYSVGDKVVSTSDAGVVGGYYFECTAAGTSGAKPPAFNLIGTVSDGTVTWGAGSPYSTSGGAVEDQMQAIIDDVLGAGQVTLYTPSTPGWQITQFVQRQEPLMEALRTLAGQIGWDVRYLWDSGTSQYRLTFYEPDRANTTPARTFTSSEYYRIGQLRQSRAGVRNVGELKYLDAATGTVKTVRAEDSGSIAKYGRRYIGITEAATSNIDSATEAQSMIDGIISDLSEPVAEVSVELDYFSPAMLGDLYRLQANGVHHDSDLDLAVAAFQHTLRAGSWRTTLMCRGKPSGGFRRWHEMDGRAGVSAPQQNIAPGVLEDLATAPTIGGATVAFKLPHGARYAEAYLHLGNSSDFTPSSSTQVAQSRSTRFDVTGLDPGVPQYVRVVLDDGRGNKSISEAKSVTPDYVGAAHILPEIKHGFSATRASNTGLERGADKEVSPLLNSEGYDYGEAYSSGVFTAGAAGRYQFRATVVLSGAYPGDTGHLYLQKNGSAVTSAIGPSRTTIVDPSSGAMVLALDLDVTLSLAQGDTVKLMATTASPRGVNSYTLLGTRSSFQCERLLTGN
ncbi:MAG TPA: hypothetical protein VIK91_19680 [Nannocystis sp.]